MRVFVAGASGSVGSEVVRLAKAAGHQVGALSRSRKPDGVADEVFTLDATSAAPDLGGYEVVISALGAPVSVSHPERRGYRDVDLVANRNLLLAAQQAGVRRFVYVSVHVEPGYAHTAYIRAHEEFVEDLRRSSLSHSVIRPTGIFSAFDDFIGLARKGLATAISDGKARTNPVHAADVAELVMRDLESGPAESSIGGPDVFTRREIAELAFRVLGKRPRIVHVPAPVFRLTAKLAAPFHPRLGDLLEFVTAVSTSDSLAPRLGRRRLEDYFREVVR